MTDSPKNKHLKPYDYKINELDNDGATVKKIYAKDPVYVIYRTDTAIRVDMDDDSEALAMYTKNHYKIGVDLARIYSWLPENLSGSEPINKQIARAMATNIAGNYEDAKAMLTHAEARIKKLKIIKGKIQYTLSTLSVVLFLLLITFVFSKHIDGVFAKVLQCGALGGLLSIAVGYNTLGVDIDANWKTNSLVGGFRIVIAVIASIFSYLAIQSGLAFSFIQDNEYNYGVLLIAMTAGFAEMLVPNMINKLSSENFSADKKLGEN
ncbi:hypothetical protein Q7I15_19610 [Aeromonas veronii]|uniref:hypothetical protein n=1 Tax=Aeromonas veronii TaxID=654 RepID=UPI00300744E0